MQQRPSFVNPATDWKSFMKKSAWSKCCSR